MWEKNKVPSQINHYDLGECSSLAAAEYSLRLHNDWEFSRIKNVSVQFEGKNEFWTHNRKTTECHIKKKNLIRDKYILTKS